ncbi:MAG: hypothetical protein IH940_09025 [Acidobacteria bacterium]|nr:hypothetical protein [Acidobacteriota bacterium]
MDLILVCTGVMVAAALVALIAQRLFARNDNTVLELDRIDLTAREPDGSTESAARRLLGSIDTSLDAMNPPNDTTAVLCMVSTVTGRIDGPTVYIAPAGPDMVHRRRPWERVELPGMQRLVEVADREPEQVADRLNGLVRGWVQNLYREVTSVEPSELGDVLKRLRRVGGTVRDDYSTGMGLSEIVGGTRLVACLLLVAPERCIAEREVTVVVETVLAAQWIDNLGNIKLWRQQPTQDTIEIASVSSLIPS